MNISEKGMRMSNLARETRKLLERLFSFASDAEVIDFDFSKWDKEVSLVVLVNDAWNGQGRGNFQRVSFFFVEELNWKSNNSDNFIPVDNHRGWLVDQIEISEESGFIVAKLRGMAASPDITIKCDRIEIVETVPWIIEDVNPNWRPPGSGLARPGLEELYARIKAGSGD
jgi:hypothetical protein